MPTPMLSASNSCCREKLAIVSLFLASASAVISGSLPMSVTTRVTTAACRAWSSRIAACFASTCAISWLQHRRQFRGVAGERNQAARHIELAGRQREGVDRAGIEDRHLVGLVGTIGRRHQPVDGLADQGFELRIVIGAAIGRQDPFMLALGGGRLRNGAVSALAGSSAFPATRSGTGCRGRRSRPSAKAMRTARRAQPKGGGSSGHRAVPHPLTPSHCLRHPACITRPMAS